jgi:hypothetical protein
LHENSRFSVKYERFSFKPAPSALKTNSAEFRVLSGTVPNFVTESLTQKLPPPIVNSHGPLSKPTPAVQPWPWDRPSCPISVIPWIQGSADRARTINPIFCR